MGANHRTGDLPPTPSFQGNNSPKQTRDSYACLETPLDVFERKDHDHFHQVSGPRILPERVATGTDHRPAQARQAGLLRTRGIPPGLPAQHTGKLLKALMARRLSYWEEKYKLFPVTQFGGRPGRNTEQALLMLSNAVDRAWVRHRVITLVPSDLKGALNIVNKITLDTRL